jgi:transposase InsO family protein
VALLKFDRDFAPNPYALACVRGFSAFDLLRYHSSNTRMRWRMVRRMRGRCLVARSKIRRALSRLPALPFFERRLAQVSAVELD